MALLSGSLSVTRFNIRRPNAPLDFDSEAFRAIQPGSEVRERVGFVPFEPGGEYELPGGRLAFRLRIDRLVPDPTQVRERLADLVRAELEATGAEFVGPRKRKELRSLAEEEQLQSASPRSQIVEAVMDQDVLYVGSTLPQQLDRVAEFLRRLGVAAEPKAPWLDDDEPEAESTILSADAPGTSVNGCRFLQEILGDPDVIYEPHTGYVKLQTHHAKVTLDGGVMSELSGFLKKGAEILAAKLVWGERTFRLDGLTFRITGLSIPPLRNGHWTERLEERIQQVEALYEQLDEKYFQLRRPRRRTAYRAAVGGAEPDASPGAPPDDNVVVMRDRLFGDDES